MLRVYLLGPFKVEHNGRALTPQGWAAAVLEAMGHDVEDSFPRALVGETGPRPALRVISTSNMTAQLHTWSERIGRRLTSDDVSPRVWKGAELGRSCSAADVHKAAARLASGIMRAPEWWTRGFDLLVTPTVQQPPPRWDERQPGDEAAVWGLFTMPFSLSAQPAVSLPLHWTPEGLPVGVQFVADYGREDVLIRIAAKLEEAMPWHGRIPGSAHKL